VPYFIDIAGGPLQLALSTEDLRMIGNEVTELPNLIGTIDMNSIGLLLVKEVNTATAFRLLQHCLLLQNFEGYCSRYNSEHRTIEDMTFRRERFKIDEIEQMKDKSPVIQGLKEALRKADLRTRPAKEQFPGQDLITSLASWTFDDYKDVHLKLSKIDQGEADSEWTAEIMRYYISGKIYSATQSFLLLFGARDKDNHPYEAVLLNTRLGITCDKAIAYTIDNFPLKKETWTTQNATLKGPGHASYMVKALFKQRPHINIKMLTKYGFSAEKHFLNKPYEGIVEDCEVIKRERFQRDKEILELAIKLEGQEPWIPLSEVGILKIETLPQEEYKYSFTVILARAGFIPTFNPTEDIVEEHTLNIKREMPNPQTVTKPPYWGPKMDVITRKLKGVYKDYLDQMKLSAP
jgi:hypothetical protein